MTDRNAVKVALLLAIDTERSLINAYRTHDDRIDETEEGVKIARRNIAAFRRVLDRYYGGARMPRMPTGKPISILTLMGERDEREFDPNAPTDG